MKKPILPLLLALALALTGCASLLERSYSVVEPYTDRYWDTAAEDTLRAESYQDLVNSLLMLVEQRSEEGVIRYYAEPSSETYLLAVAARREVQQDTVLGSYLLEDISMSSSSGESYITLTFEMSYRQDAEDPESLMVLSDTQSLVDLLRMAVREGHEKLTARFFAETPREDVIAAMESLWLELHQDDTTPTMGTEPTQTTEGSTTAAEGESAATEETTHTPASDPEGEGTEPTTPTDPEGETSAPATEGEVPASAVTEYPPCPWEIRFYPDQETAEIVEILLTEN